MKTILSSLAIIAALASPALAGSCPGQMLEIEAALTTTTVDDATKTQVQALYDTGKAAHEAGDHAASEKALGEAKALLKI